MAGISYDGVELRKLPPRFRLQLSQILDVDNSWKKLMAKIPSERNNNEFKYKAEHIDLVERHSFVSRKLPTEVLLDEWSTSGRIRPTVEILFELLQECQLYRAADYVATEILDIPPPTRPSHGPAQCVPPLDSNLNISESKKKTKHTIDTTSTVVVKDTAFDSFLEKLNNYDYTQGNPVHFELDIIESATNNFQDSIGSGAFGTVYALDLRPKGPKLAVKLLDPISTLIESQFVTEIRILSEFRHENVVPLVGFCTNGPRFCLIYEFMSGGNLLDAIAESSEEAPLSWSMRIHIMLGIIKGIHYLHTAKEKPLIHRDIKSANVLLQIVGVGELKAKIGDFGLAKSLNTSNQTSVLTSTIFGTGLYMSPEAFRGDISPKMDVFSFGVIILELLTGLPPFDESRYDGSDIVTYVGEVVEDDNIQPWLDEVPGNIDPTISSNIYNIALKCLAEKRRRPTSDQILEDVLVLSSSLPTAQNYL